jgi:hypothetical protein
MKKRLLTAAVCILLSICSYAQTTVSFATGGSPLYAAPWTMGGSASGVGTSHVQLTPPSGSQSGRIYTSTPITLTGCGSFTAEFEFQVIPSSSAWAIADGIAFWILSPLSSFSGGGGIGLPANPNGLVLVLDNYDNDGTPNDPLVSLYGYPTGYSGSYIEGSTTYRLGALSNQTYVSDGGWHHVKVTYAGGLVKVFINHSATPNISGTFPITSTNLYFGFCAATGGAWSTQSVRNCVITYDNVSPITGPDVVCMSTTGVYTDSAASGTWSSSNPGVGTISTSGILTPISAGTTTVSYTYGSGPCYATKVVTVNATTLPAIGGPNPLCSSTAGTYTNTVGAGTWSSSNAYIGSIDATSGVYTPVWAGTTTITYTLPVGCYRTSTLTVTTAPPALTISPSPITVCDNGSATLTATGATTYHLFPPQSWETGVPTTAGTAVDMWTYTGLITSAWYQELGATAVNPTITAAESGSYVANFHSRSLGAGTYGYLYSPTFSMAGVTTATFSIWVYRDATAAYNTATYDNEAITIYLFGSSGGSGTIGTIPRRTGLGISGAITGTSTPGSSGWYQYTYTLPSTLVGTANYIYIYAFSRNGNNIYIDNATVTGTTGPPTWSPSTYLFNDPAFTTAYTGTPLSPVYLHPTGISAPTPITYTASVSNGTCTSTGSSVATLNPNPGSITGTTLICVASTVTLNCTPSAGSWSSSAPTIASIGSSSGILSGVAAGTATITYSFGGCYSTTVVTVVASPGTITGIATVCLGSTTSLSNPTAGGVWSSSNPAVGSVDPSSGIVTGVSLGTAVITYGIATCYSVLTVSVNPYPTTITGSLGVCVSATTALSSTPSGGFWFTSAGTIATVGVISGIVTGVSPGTAIISYRLGGCAATTTVNVVTTPGSMTGTLTTCVGSSTTLSHLASGGTWSSSLPSVATVGTSSGIVTGVATGTTRITYTVGTGCYTSSVVTVTAAPPAPTGTFNLCIGNTTTLSHSTFGGTWSCACPTIATVGLGTGIVTGVGAGTCIITYALPSGCLALATVTVDPLTAPITGTLTMCAGGTTTLSTATPVTSWSSSSPAVATISSTGVVTGISAGTATMTCPAIGGCPVTAVVTVNPLPAAITGTASFCCGNTTTLFNTTPLGGWSSSNLSIATVSGGGIVSCVAPGTATISYTLPTGCYTTRAVTTNAGPAAITGTAGLCVGYSTTLGCITTGGVWSSGNVAVATILGPGLVGGVSAGTAVISYTVGSCSSTIIVTVNAVPGAIGGTLNVCAGQTTTLTNSASGGSWSSLTPANGTIDATTGILTGIAGGTTTISYSLGSGCGIAAVATINALPGAIGGALIMCAGANSVLTNATSGGTWFCSCPGVGTIGVGTGLYTSTGAGTCIVTYSLPTTCMRTATLTVNALPAVITGPTTVCIGQTVTLSDASPGGVWTSSNGNATIDPSTGIATGVFSGTSTITYTVSGCYRTMTFLINPLPTGISPTGAGLQVCEGSTLSFTGSPSGGVWSSACPAVGTITAGSGIFSAMTAGNCRVTYTSVTGCSLVSGILTVNSLPAAIGGITSACVGQCTTLNCTPAAGTWSISSGTGSASIGTGTGVVCGISSGTTRVTYTLPTGCRSSTNVSVNALPGVITGVSNTCIGSTTTLNCSPSGGTWSMTCANASIGVTTGVVTGISAGTCSVTYTAGAGCYSTRDITVNALPNPIVGAATLCVGQTTTLGTTSTGGTWSCTPGVASIDAAGNLTGTSAGTTTVSYTSATGCRVTTVVTVYGLPGAITGSLQVCAGSTGTLSTTTPGGTWTMACPAIGTVDAASGALTGIAAGTCAVTYSLGTGCSTSAITTVNSIPSPVTGTLQVCEGSNTTLSTSTPFGFWTSSAPGTATVVSGTGVVTGVAGTGTATISYTVGSGCSSIAVVTVYALPSAITGPAPMEVCENSSITLSCIPGGGAWSSPDATVSVVSGTGVVNGLTAGTATISYTIGIGCVRTTTVVVNPQPAAIAGNLNVCIGFTSLFTTTSTGGTWTSSNPAIAPIDAAGLASGLTLGTTNISYTLPVTGCMRSVQATVQPLPSTITGSSGFCNLSSTTYLSSPGGGTWTSADTNILVIDPISGLATGRDTFSVDIIYTLPTGCSTSKNVFLILAPFPITGPHDMCLGQTRTLGNFITGGVWSSDNSLICSIDASTGVATGNTIGVTTITYVLSSGCFSTYSVTVNPIPGGVSGPSQVCESYTGSYTCGTPGGTWSTSNPALGSIDVSSGVLTALAPGVITVTYTLGTGCNAMKTVTLNGLPAPITGTFQVCEGTSTTLTTASSGGLWQTADPGVMDIDALTGVMTGMSAMTTGVGGLGITVVSYTLPTGCYVTENVSVNPLPSPISGIMNICVGDMTVLTNPTPGGGWVSSVPAVGTIDGVSGAFAGLTAGTTTISYLLPTGCIATWPMTVNANPVAIGGTLSVCAGFSTNLTSGPSGGVWSQDPMSMGYGTINATTGVVSGIVAGVIPVSYTLGSGCRVTENVTVVTLPAVISGPPRVCVDDSVILTNIVSGGTWSSSNPTRATIDPLIGRVNGLLAGTTVMTYSVGTGCFNVLTMTVNPLPLPITGPMQVCGGATILLSSGPTPGGNWISDTTSVATVGYISGIVTGISAGVSNISYVIGATGCLRSVQVTVNATPGPIQGNPHVCMGSSNTFTDTLAGGLWSISNPAIATIGAATGVVTSVSVGTVIITYQYPATGCMATRVISVQPLPNVYNVTGGGNYCSGGSGLHINLSGSQAGVSYALYRGATAAGYLPGTGFGLDFGLLTASGVYTVQATNVTSGCTKNMAGSATIVVNPLVTPSVTINTAPLDTVCPGQTVTLTPIPVNGGTAPSYLWKVNGVSVSSLSVYGYIPANGDIVTVSMTSNATCLSAPIATGIKSLTVLTNEMPVAGLIATPGDTICQYSPVVFTAAPLFGGPSPVYTWLLNGTAAGTGSTYSFIPVDGDVVNLQMVSDYRCGLANIVTSGDVALSVDSLLIPNVTVWPEPGLAVEIGKPITLHATVTNGGALPKYQWKVNGHPVAGATTDTYTAVFNDYDSVACEIISGGVCNNIGTSDWVFITTLVLGNHTIVTANTDLRLVPNPNKGWFTVKGTLGSKMNEEAAVEITDMLGQLVYRGTLQSKSGKVDAAIQLDNTLANGMYLLTVRTESGSNTFHFVLEQ